MTSPREFLLYGATGYTAGLIRSMAPDFGLIPILAGRNETTVKALADQHGLGYRVADLSDATALDAMLRGQLVVLHCAGPFSKTALPMQQACLRTGVDYLDITGEIDVFEQGFRLDKRAQAAGSMLMSGVGFDVVPTDCLALHLKNQLSDATHLQLAFANAGGSISHGTAQTAAENLGTGGLVRENGLLKPVPNAYKTLSVAFKPGTTLLCMSIPWGDVSTAYQTTGISNIETFMAAPAGQIRLAKLGNSLGWLLRNQWIQRLIRNRISRSVTGPDENTRQTARSLVWGQVRNQVGETATARLDCPEGYTLTALTALTIVRDVLDGKRKAGFQTPAGLYGPDLILQINGVTRTDGEMPEISL